MHPIIDSSWSANWIWSLPLIAVTVMFHSFGLGLLNQQVSLVLNDNKKPRLPHGVSVLMVGGISICAAILHGLEGGMWAGAYVLLGALPNTKSAMMYSLNAITSYGHEDLHLELHWQLMGSLEALNGWILFGLTTAFMFTVIQKVWSYREQSN